MNDERESKRLLPFDVRVAPGLPFTVHRLRFSFNDLSNFGDLPRLRHRRQRATFVADAGPAWARGYVPIARRSSRPRPASAIAAAAGGAARPRPPRSDRKAWLLAGTACVLLVGGIVYKVTSDRRSPRARHGERRAPAQRRAEAAGPAPDISAMTPRERFDRLYNRIMQASERSDSAEVGRLPPWRWEPTSSSRPGTPTPDITRRCSRCRWETSRRPRAGGHHPQGIAGPPVRLRHPGHGGQVSE